MAYNIVLTDAVDDLGLEPYEDHRTYGKPNTPVEDEMLRHSLEIAKKEGWVKSYSKKVMTTMEA